MKNFIFLMIVQLFVVGSWAEDAYQYPVKGIKRQIQINVLNDLDLYQNRNNMDNAFSHTSSNRSLTFGNITKIGPYSFVVSVKKESGGLIETQELQITYKDLENFSKNRWAYGINAPSNALWIDAIGAGFQNANTLTLLHSRLEELQETYKDVIQASVDGSETVPRLTSKKLKRTSAGRCNVVLTTKPPAKQTTY